jgi:glycosyltransferase involved in cell wall biosynthesis
MRIAIIANSAWCLAHSRLHLMAALSGAGHEVICAAAPGRETPAIIQAGFEFVPIPFTGCGMNPFTELRTVYALAALLRRRRIDLVFSFTPKGNIYAALAALLNGIAFVPNITGLGRAFIHRSWITRIVGLLYRFTLSRAHRVFFQNDDDLGLFVKAGLVPATLAERIPGSGVDLNHFVPAPPPCPPGAPATTLLLIARLMWDKGVGEFVQAARRIRATNPEVRFLLLGYVGVENPSAVGADQVHAWEGEGVIEYLGQTDDVRPFIAAADAVVLPSYREGVPRTLLEGAAMARPVITTDEPGCRDAVIDGVSGFLCKSHDATDLECQIRRFLALSATRRHEQGLAGRSLVERQFDERFVLARYTQVAKAVEIGTRGARLTARPPTPAGIGGLAAIGANDTLKGD